VNPHLMNFYRHLQRGLRIDLPMENDEKAFYAHRTRFNALLEAGKHDGADAASLFYYLNRTGYNGLCRFNASGGFNVPYGRYAAIGYREAFEEYRATLAGWDLTNTSFDDLELKAGDFVYADPPYDVQFTTYSKGGFGWEDQVRVAKWLARHEGPVILVNQATTRIVELYASLGFSIRFLSAPRRISCTGDRTDAREVMALRNL
jgi:DNA adenine methylase